ncbi:MAG: FG-GAP-like repeat-containing protein [Pseudoxanthomonas sp.]
MPSLRRASIVPQRTRRLAGLLVGLASASCESLFGSYAVDNQDNCVLNVGLCPAPAQTCNVNTKLCEEATQLVAIDPKSGPSAGGTLVTISGSRFLAGTTVSFDGEPATEVTVVSAQQLTAKTPPRPGRQGPVVVELFSPDGQHTQKDKLFRYYGDATFQQSCFQGPTNPVVVVAADINKDGTSDIIVGGGNAIRPYLSSGDGLTFQALADIKPGQTTLALKAADLNGDGKIDLTTLSYGSTNAIATALGNGDGTFQALVKTPTTRTPYGLAVGDVTGDKRPDVLTLQNLDLVVQSGSGDGTFQAEQNTPYAVQSARGTSAQTLVDLDGDGFVDSATLNPIEQSFNVLFGRAGGWSTPLATTLSREPNIILASDYDQDGLTDLAVGLNRTYAKIELFQGQGSRKLGAMPQLVLKTNFRLEAQGDFNGDGLADLVALDAGGLNNNLMIYLGTGDWRFAALAPLSVGVSASAAAVGDWNGDGRQDLVTISSVGDTVCVLRSQVQ